MKPVSPVRGFTVLELLAAMTITLVLAGLMLSVAAGTLALWRRAQDNFTASTQAGLALDLLERDLRSALFRKDGATWLAVDVSNSPGALATHGWLVNAPVLKPASGESQRLLPAAPGGGEPVIAEARFGFSGAWLRFITTNVESGASLPVAVSYQLARRPVSGAVSAANPAEIRYALFRSVVTADDTLANGYDVRDAAYGSNSATPAVPRHPRTLTNPSLSDTLATNAVDFGIWLYVRDASGGLRRIFPADNADLSHAAQDAGAAADASRFPEVADVMVRLLSEQGAALIDSIEQGRLARPRGYASDAEWWWAAVEANSRVYARRVEMKGAAQ